ncbi:MAG: hypothetical protein ACD_76C00114G0002 [uncultured bacterium]|nr:MAG: hypothetical protein ACD_76C00114G0002 [uncultured bacterium]HBD05342.1 hypothetical protein [Candidatus Uhrbacteria bacterium]
MEVFKIIFYQPLFNLLIWLYDILPVADIGIAIILVTLIIKLALFPLSAKSIKSQKSMQELQPKIEELKEKYKNDKEKMAKEMMVLYKENKVNPLSSCLPLLIQLPILFALYRVLINGLTDANSFDDLYSFVQNPGAINTMFIGIVDLARASIPLAVLAGAAQFVSVRLMASKRPPKQVRKKEGARDENMLASMNQSMMYFMPIITVVIGSSLPGGLTLYWFATNLFQLLQEIIVLKKNNNNDSPGAPEQAAVAQA